jgi:hypothetical protein
VNAENSYLNLASFSLAILDLQVLTSAGEEVFFKIKRNTKLSKLQAAYANKVGKDVGSIRYVRERFSAPSESQSRTDLLPAWCADRGFPLP